MTDGHTVMRQERRGLNPPTLIVCECGEQFTSTLHREATGEWVEHWKREVNPLTRVNPPGEVSR